MTSSLHGWHDPAACPSQQQEYNLQLCTAASKGFFFYESGKRAADYIKKQMKPSLGKNKQIPSKSSHIIHSNEQL